MTNDTLLEVSPFHIAMAPSAAPADLAAGIFEATNQIRAENGLRALLASASLNQSAGGWAVHMAATNDYTHGANPWARMQAAGFQGNGTWGENIAAAYGD